MSIDRILNCMPKNQLLLDMANEHRKIIHGAVAYAIREITGRDPKEIQDHEMVINLGIETPLDSQEYVSYHWKGREILRAYAPITHYGSHFELCLKIPSGCPAPKFYFGVRRLVFQPVDQVWRRDKLRGTTGQKQEIKVVPQ